MSILEKFGNPFQARVVPTLVERVAEAQIANITSIVKYRLEASRSTNTTVFYRHMDVPSNGAYSFIANLAFSTKTPSRPTKLKEILEVVLSRFGERAQVEPIDHCDHPDGGHMYAFSWGLRLEEDLMQSFERYELPTFSHSPTECLVTYRISLQEPIVNRRLQALREAAEACGAVVSLIPISDRELEVIVIGESHYPLTIQPERERMEWLDKQLADWQIIDKSPVGEILDTVPVPPIVENTVVSLPQVFEQATHSFILEKVMHSAIEQCLDFEDAASISKEKCCTLFGAPITCPDIHTESLRWKHTLKFGDALLVIEGVDSRVDEAYVLPGKEPAAQIFNLIIEMIRK